MVKICGFWSLADQGPTISGFPILCRILANLNLVSPIFGLCFGFLSVADPRFMIIIDCYRLCISIHRLALVQSTCVMVIVLEFDGGKQTLLTKCGYCFFYNKIVSDQNKFWCSFDFARILQTFMLTAGTGHVIDILWTYYGILWDTMDIL